MKTIKELNSEIHNLENQVSMLETKLKDSIYNAMIKVASEDKAQRKISDKLSIIKSSDLISSPWNPQYFNWEEAVECIYDYLENKKPSMWIDYLQGLLDKSKDKRIVNISKKSGSRVLNVPVQYKLIEEIIKEISK